MVPIEHPDAIVRQAFRLIAQYLHRMYLHDAEAMKQAEQDLNEAFRHFADNNQEWGTESARTHVLNLGRTLGEMLRPEEKVLRPDEEDTLKWYPEGESEWKNQTPSLLQRFLRGIQG